eukprot:TRINITY_DN104830_c0_g1_i1.p2 TRINITY_DN104830_c0_g1~~TRINITY_DN104830_c0_g1_i1.p2  ORF type:complete len:106 (+),score=21.57 TRINITY_DN104830_c0_g1_i1:287-604(+)
MVTVGKGGTEGNGHAMYEGNTTSHASYPAMTTTVPNFSEALLRPLPNHHTEIHSINSWPAAARNAEKGTALPNYAWSSLLAGSTVNINKQLTAEYKHTKINMQTI